MRAGLIVLLGTLWATEALALSMDREPFQDAVFEAIHQGDRDGVLLRLKQGYDPNTPVYSTPAYEVRPRERTAVTYAAKCRRLDILQDLIAYGGKVNYSAILASRSGIPSDVRWAYGEARQEPPDTFAYLFWNQGYYARYAWLLLALLCGFAIAIPLDRRKRDAR